MTHFDIANTHICTVHTWFTRYHTVQPHFDIVHAHFGTGHTLAQFTHCSQAMTEFTHFDIVHADFGTVHTLLTSYNTL